MGMVQWAITQTKTDTTHWIPIQTTVHQEIFGVLSFADLRSWAILPCSLHATFAFVEHTHSGEHAGLFLLEDWVSDCKVVKVKSLVNWKYINFGYAQKERKESTLILTHNFEIYSIIFHAINMYRLSLYFICILFRNIIIKIMFYDHPNFKTIWLKWLGESVEVYHAMLHNCWR